MSAALATIGNSIITSISSFFHNHFVFSYYCYLFECTHTKKT